MYLICVLKEPSNEGYVWVFIFLLLLEPKYFM